MHDALRPPLPTVPPVPGSGFSWRTRALPGDRGPSGLTLAIDVRVRLRRVPREEWRAIRDRTLGICAQLADVALREGFRAELLPARRRDDAGEAGWTCAARLRLTPPSGAATGMAGEAGEGAGFPAGRTPRAGRRAP